MLEFQALVKVKSSPNSYQLSSDNSAQVVSHSPSSFIHSCGQMNWRELFINNITFELYPDEIANATFAQRHSQINHKQIGLYLHSQTSESIM